MYRYFKRIAGVGNYNYIYYWKCKGLSDEKINSITVSNYSVIPFLDYYDTKKEYNLVEVVWNKIKLRIFIYEISKSINISDYPTLENCLMRAVSLIKNVNIDKYGSSGYGVGFDRY